MYDLINKVEKKKNELRQLIAVLLNGISKLKSDYSLDSDFDATFERYKTHMSVVADLTEQMKNNMNKLDAIYQVLIFILIIRLHS